MKAKTSMIPLSGLDHVRKEKKYQNRQILYRKFIFSLKLTDIYKKLLIGILLIFLFFYAGVIIDVPIKAQDTGIKGALPAITAHDRLLVIVAHPDDESIGAGGLMYDAVQKGTNVSVIVVSTGDANKFSAGVMSKTPEPKAKDFIIEGTQRIQESTTALTLLGVKNIYFLGFPDRDLKILLTKNWDSILKSKYSGFSTNQYSDTYRPGSVYKGSEVENQLESIISQDQPTVIITHVSQDSNPDHQAVTQFVTKAVDNLVTQKIIQKPLIYGFLVHWQSFEYPRPFRKATNFPLNPPKELVKKCSWLSYPINKSTQNQKEVALKSYVSQLKSPFLKSLIEALDRTNELFCPLN